MTGTSRSSSHYSPASATASLPPSWAPPNAPLPPHRLAKLANALGIATPIPVVHTVPTISAPPSEGRQTPTDPLRRSPTPFASSNSSVTAYTTATSKYLLHVIPPLHLPHDLDPSGPFELTPAPPNASGYHPQFRRGVLVPFHSNFQSQLGAIAKEYALPSTTGMILYLVNSRPTNIQSRSPTPAPEDVKDAEGDEPGPRLSEDIWKHLWTRVVRSEPRDDTLLLPSRSPTPNFALNASQEPPDQPPLRPFISTSGLDVHRGGPITPTTPSTATTSEDRSHSRALFSSSGSLASDPDTPETSSISSTSLLNDRAAKRADSLELPGLHSLSSIPILAKVEFDIDRRRAGWYEAWMRSRRVNHAKRAESRQGRGDLEGDEKVEEQKRALIGLLTGTKESANFISLLSQPDASKSEGNVAEGYEPLPEPQENDDSDDGDAGEQVPNTEDLTARNLFGGRDPLEDVFGTDAETWEEMRSSRPRDSKPNNSNPHIVNLALTGAELTSEQDPQRLGDNEFEGDIDESKEADEVKDLLERMSRPRVSVSIPTSPPQTSSPGLTQGSSKKHVPPPLILQPMSASNFNDLVVPAEPSPNPSTPGSTGLPYLHSPSPREKEDDEVHYSRENILRDGGGSLDDFNQTRSPEESEKRVGTVFEELDLGSQYESSEEFEYDENDPNDRRRSQYVMKTKLDEIEKTFAQLSPRMLNIDLAEEQNLSLSGASLTISNGLLDAPVASPILRNADVLPSSPKFPNQASSSSDRDSDLKHAAWPAVPFSSLHEAPNTSPTSLKASNLPPSPPRLAVNGVTTSAPKSFNPTSKSPNEISPETEQRMRELEEEHALFHHKSSSSQLSLPLPGTVNSIASADSHESEPIIPLSPDPFGRYPSSQDFIGSTGSSVTYWEPESRPSLSIDSTGTAADLPPRSESVATSRFSLDTVPDEEITQPPTKQNGAKSTFGAITKLWKKGSKTPISQSHPPPPPTPTVTTYAGRISSEIPPRPSQDRLDTPTSSAGFTTPTTPTFGRLSVQPTPPPQAPLMSHLPAALQAGRPSMDSLNVPQQHAPQQSSPLHSHPRPGQPLMNANGSGVSPRLSTRSLGYDQLHFDQESPYPFRRYTPQSSSTPVSSTVTLPHTDHAPATPALSSSPTNDKPSSTNGIRKNLLKGWKSGSSSSVSSASGDHEPSRLSLDKPGRPRKGSVLHYSASPEPIPPSPQIPEQFLQRKTSDSRQPPQMVANNKPRMNSASTGGQAPRSSFASSDSGETRPSFDVSQFEIVSPRNVGYAT